MAPKSPSRSADADLDQLRKAAAAPDAVQARYALAIALIDRGLRGEAERHLAHLARIAPAFAPVVYTQGCLALADGRLGEAERLLRRAASAPALAIDASLALAETLERAGRREEALRLLRAIVARRPGIPSPYINFTQMRLSAAPREALDAADAGLARFPKAAILHALRGQALIRLNDPDAAILALRRALDLDPGLAPAAGHLLRATREAARWDEEDAAMAAVRRVRAAANPGTLAIPLHSALNFGFDAAEMKSIAVAEAAFRGAGIAPLPPVPASAAEPLVVGYLSPDYRDHAIAHLVADIFGAHDPKRVRAVAFSEGPDDGDPVRAEIAATAAAFVDLGRMSDAEAAARIRAEGVHILVDLSLYTRFHRPGVMARRPAPVQVAWLGLPATSGAPWIDYLFVDDIVAPPAHADRYTEILVHLPCGYQPNRKLGALDPTPSRADLALPEDAVVFGCFNSHRKIDHESFSRWLAVLRGVPGSVLWLLAPPEAVAARYRTAAEAAGLSPDRLIFAPKASRAAHLARLPQADLMLDTLIYGAHTTCSDALRAGVPMLTVLGEQFAARVAASLVSRAGLPELVCADHDAFVAEAIRLGTDAEARAALRQKLARAVPASPVFDPQVQARALEDAYAAIWAKHLGA
jgi:protein O-GlcNAc transferase